MADITASATGDPVVEANTRDQLTLLASVAVTALQSVYVTSSHQWALGNAGAAGTVKMLYVALKTVAAGQPLTASRRCIVDGLDLSAMADGDPIYASDTAGAWGTTAGTVTVVAGRVIPALGAIIGGTANKLAKFDIPL